MHKLFFRILFFALLIALPCSANASELSNALAKYPPGEYAILFGHIDTSTVDFHLNEVRVKSYPPQAQGLFRPDNNSEKNVVERGVDYFWSFVKPGDYYLHEAYVAQMRMFGSSMKVKFPDPTTESSNKIARMTVGKLQYMGSASFVQTGHASLLSYGRFALQANDVNESPQLLEHLKAEAKGTAWEPIIAGQLAAIAKPAVSVKPATAPQAAAPLSALAPSTAELRFDGVYQEFNELTKRYSYYRFFENGSVTYYATNDPTEQPAAVYAALEQKPFGRGNYRLEDGIVVFSLTFARGNVDYKASVSGDALKISLYSHITNTNGTISARFLAL